MLGYRINLIGQLEVPSAAAARLPGVPAEQCSGRWPELALNASKIS